MMDDDIYGDLENYNDVNAIEELRNEIKELKFKLEEYASSKEKLQKDFDRVSSDFNKLSINYSSLLKTSRAEIERKTQLIANLNAEKDMMVLNSIQNSNKILFNIRRNMAREKLAAMKKNAKGVTKGAKEMPDIKKVDHERERIEENRLPSMDTVISSNTDDTNKMDVEAKHIKKDSYTDMGSESKENISIKRPRAQSLRNRRKSMPVLSKQFTDFSSDEEGGKFSGEDLNKRDLPSRDTKIRRNFERECDKQSHKVSETSGIDEKYSSHHESSRETCYANKLNRLSDKFRAREKYEPSQKHRRHYSPDRKKQRAEVPYQRRENRHRVLESPPHWKSKEGKYESQRRGRDRHPNYDRTSHYTRSRSRHERYATKHKASSDYDEPSLKKIRTASTDRHLEHENKMKIHFEDKVIAKTIDNAQHTSCQSPDYVNIDAVLNTPVKEIMNTAATPLEDPRLSSNKYSVETKDNKVVLSTITGRNIIIKPIDKSVWNIPVITLPEVLKRPPNQGEKIHNIYMDIDNPISNMSMESGEIRSDTNDLMSEVVTNSVFDDYNYKALENTTKIINLEERKQMREEMIRNRDRLKQQNDKEMADIEVKNQLLNRKMTCKLGKIKTVDKINTEINKRDEYLICKDIYPNIKNDAPAIRSEQLSNVSKDTNKYKIPKKKPGEDDHVQATIQVSNPLELLFQEMEEVKDKSDSKKSFDFPKRTNNENPITCDIKQTSNTVKPKNITKSSRRLTSSELVEGDLELSDDTYDNSVFLKKSIYETKAQSLPVQIRIAKQNKFDKKYCKTDLVDIKLDKQKTNELSNERKEKVIEELSKSIQNTNTKNTTKSKPRSKRDNFEDTEKSMSPEENVEKKIQSKKLKGTKIENTMSKFKDLFGENSSLITPEDLGFTTVQSKTPDSNKYVPIFEEEAQDAIDVNVREIGRIQALCKDVSSVSNNEALEDETTFKTLHSKPDFSKKSDDILIFTQDADAQMATAKLYENLYLETPSKDAGVVSTVIVSRGVQPIVPKNCEIEEVSANNNNVKENEKQSESAPKVSSALPPALATSTPYKALTRVCTDNDICSNSNDSTIKTASIDSSSVITGISMENETDIPDLRIHVKRRKRVLKKA